MDEKTKDSLMSLVGQIPEAYSEKQGIVLEDTFTTMREATPEERQAIQDGIDKISKPTGINFWDNVGTKVASVYCPKIINGSTLSIGDKIAKTQFKVYQHFNWFQKLMWKWCFGVKVEDYSEE